MNRRGALTWAALALTGGWGCGAEAPRDDGPRVTVAVAPLTLPGVTEARYDLTVKNLAGEVVWTRTDLSSQRYGDGTGALSFAGPCDADASPNTVTLTLTALATAAGAVPADTWHNPTPLTRSVPCVANADARVDFDLVVARAATQGFFDVAISFDDVFCSAKLDCESAPGAPLTLLHDPATGARGQTAVLAFACASGGGQDTTLYLDDVRLVCDGIASVVIPAGGPGTLGAVPPMLFETATYRGRLGDVEDGACYWNVGLGLDTDALDTDCTLHARATASRTPFSAGAPPPGATWPLLQWSVPITDAAGVLVCGEHALGSDDGVAVTYSDGVGPPLQYALACPAAGAFDPAPSYVGGLLCDGSTINGHAITVAQQGSDLVVSANGFSAGYTLDPALTAVTCYVVTPP